MKTIFNIPTAFQSTQYRIYWLGAFASVSGYNLTYFAQLWLIHQINDSTLFLGLVGAANAAPSFILTLIGGAYADRVNKKLIMIGSQIILASLVIIMAILTIFEVVEIWHILVIAVIAGSVSAFDLPSRQAFYPELVNEKSLTSAVAMNASIWQSVRIIAPAVAGFLIALTSTSVVFIFSAVGFTMMAVLLLPLTGISKEDGDNQSQTKLTDQVKDSLKYVFKKPEFRYLIGLAMFSSFFGGSYILLMPIFAVDIFSVGAEGQGVLLACSGVGSVLASLFIATRKIVLPSGTFILAACCLSGISIAVFGLLAELTGSYTLGIVLMLTTGFFTSLHMISTMAALQQMVPSELRGRVMALYGINWSLMLLGGVQAGLIGLALGAPFTVMLGGILVAALSIIFIFVNKEFVQIGQKVKEIN